MLLEQGITQAGHCLPADSLGPLGRFGDILRNDIKELVEATINLLNHLFLIQPILSQVAQHIGNENLTP